MAECTGVKFTFEMKAGTYGTKWFGSQSPRAKGEAIRTFVSQDFKKNNKEQDACSGDCGSKPPHDDCYPSSLKIAVPEGAGTFKKVGRHHTNHGEDILYESYLLVLTKDCEVTVSTTCGCIGSPMPPKG